jgi:hypothetical protein
VCQDLWKPANDVLIFFTAGRASVERSSAAESCWYSPLFDLHAAAACREYDMPQLAMSMSIDYKWQTTQELGASPNVMSYLEGSNEVQMYPLHLALQCRQQECVSALLEHEQVRNLASEIHKNL